MKVIDCISYNGEYDIWDLRYNILKDQVDEFIVVEFDKTFSGKEKPWYFDEIARKYEKVRYVKHSEEDYKEYYEEAKRSPNTEYGKGASHWIREWAQKESIKKALTHLEDEDIVYIGDVDEIWERLSWHGTDGMTKLMLRVYTYYLNNRSSEQFFGTVVDSYGGIKGWLWQISLNEMRTNASKSFVDCGWHFTSMGGPENLKKKLTDSYTEETYANKWVLDNLEKSVNNNKDFLGRDFTYKKDESEWPKYLQENKERYKHLLLTHI